MGEANVLAVLNLRRVSVNGTYMLVYYNCVYNYACRQRINATLRRTRSLMLVQV